MKKILILVFLVSLSASAFGTWTEVATNSAILNAIEGDASTTLVTLCAVGNGGVVLTSSDYGANWSEKSAPGGPHLNKVSIADNRLFAAGRPSGIAAVPKAVCLYSDNWGSSWTDITYSNFDATLAMAFGSSSNGVLAGPLSGGGGYGVVYTNNAGSSWNTSTPTDAAFAAAYFTDANTVFIAGVDGLIYKSTNGGQNWTQKGAGVTSTILYDFSFVGSNGFIVGSAGTFLTSSDNGETWNLKTISGVVANFDFYAIQMVDASTGWVCGRDDAAVNSKIYKITESGGSWSAVLEYTTLTGGYDLYDLYFTDADNGWVLEYDALYKWGKIYAQITPLAISSIVQKNRPTQTRAPVGFTGDLTINLNNAQQGTWPTSNVVFSGSGVTVNSVTRVSKTELTANVAIDSAATTGSRTVTVTNTDLSTDDHTFTVSPLPIVTSAQPSSLAQGATDQTVVLHSSGGGFQSGLTAADISFGADITVKSVVVDSDFQMTTVLDVSVGATTGSKIITINNPDGGSYASAGIFAVSSASVTNPTITSAYPDMERNSTGILTIIGSDIQNNATVSFSTTGITINSYDYTRLAQNRLDVNITISSSAGLGAVTVTVLNTNGGVGNLNQAFYIKDAGAADPTFIAVQPTVAYQGRQDLDLYISGTGFQSGAQVSIVPPDGVTITDVNVVSTTGIRITVDIDQNATLGMRGVLIVNPDGGHVLVSDKLEIKPTQFPPEIVDDSCVVGPNPVDPASGPANIQFELTEDCVVTIRIMDCHGEILYEIVYNGQAGQNSVEWNWETFIGDGVANGMYLITVSRNGTILASTKLMVVNRGP